MDNTYNIAQAAQYLGFKVKTLQKWDREGRLIPAYRTPTNRRVYTKSQLDDFIGRQTEDSRVRKLPIAVSQVQAQNQTCSIRQQYSENIAITQA